MWNRLVKVFHSHAVDTILPFDPASYLDGTSDEMVEIVRTSAARAAASRGFADSSGVCGFLPRLRPALGELIFGGTGARAPSVWGGAFAGLDPRVRPSP